MKKKAFILFPLLLILGACIKKRIPVSETIYGVDYYPTTQNKFVVYDVDSAVYTEIPKDTIVYRYRIKEKLADRFNDNEGKRAIRLERYIKKYNAGKPYDSLPWLMKEVWMVNADSKNVQVSEGNVRYVKLTFPVTISASWNGNATNTQAGEQYTYDYIDQPENINGNALTNVLQVKQKEFRTLISYEKKVEKYAKGVGLVYREIDNILSNNIVAGVPVENRIESGVIYKQTLVTYGYE